MLLSGRKTEIKGRWRTVASTSSPPILPTLFSTISNNQCRLSCQADVRDAAGSLSSYNYVYCPGFMSLHKKEANAPYIYVETHSSCSLSLLKKATLMLRLSHVHDDDKLSPMLGCCTKVPACIFLREKIMEPQTIMCCILLKSCNRASTFHSSKYCQSLLFPFLSITKYMLGACSCHGSQSGKHMPGINRELSIDSYGSWYYVKIHSSFSFPRPGAKFNCNGTSREQRYNFWQNMTTGYNHID